MANEQGSSTTKSSKPETSSSTPIQTGATMVSPCTLMSTELLQAAIDGDQRVLMQEIRVGEEEEEGLNSVPVTIVEYNQIDALQQLKNLQSTTRMESTVLHILTSNGHAELARRTYIRNTSMLRPATVTRDTPLHCAARYDHAQVISKITNGVTNLRDVLQHKNKSGECALHEASRNGHVDAVSALMEADIELAGVVNKNGESPLYLATIEKSFSMVRLIVRLLRNRDITRAYYAGPEEQTALHAAVLTEDGADLTYELLKLCGRTDDEEPISLAKIGDIFESTPLHYAALAGWPTVFNPLLDYDVSLAYCDNSSGLFPIHRAALGSFDCFRLFKSCPDSGELVDRRGRNFLHIAAEVGNSVFLLKLYGCHKGAPTEKMLRKAINARDNEGNTPLCLAAARGVHMVKPLLRMEWVDINSRENIRLNERFWVTRSTEIPMEWIPVLIQRSLSDKSGIEEEEEEEDKKVLDIHWLFVVYTTTGEAQFISFLININLLHLMLSVNFFFSSFIHM